MALAGKDVGMWFEPSAAASTLRYPGRYLRFKTGRRRGLAWAFPRRYFRYFVPFDFPSCVTSSTSCILYLMCATCHSILAPPHFGLVFCISHLPTSFLSASARLLIQTISTYFISACTVHMHSMPCNYLFHRCQTAGAVT
ncbi:hypothetical protein C8R45DRAFT_1217433, partial [Mycena sanguinolenta]